jgi:hypothetical protein
MMSIVLGLGSWGAMEMWGGNSIWPPQLVGLGFAITGMLIGSLATRVPGRDEATLRAHSSGVGGHR